MLYSLRLQPKKHGLESVSLSGDGFLEVFAHFVVVSGAFFLFLGIVSATIWLRLYGFSTSTLFDVPIAPLALIVVGYGMISISGLLTMMCFRFWTSDVHVRKSQSL